MDPGTSSKACTSVAECDYNCCEAVVHALLLVSYVIDPIHIGGRLGDTDKCEIPVAGLRSMELFPRESGEFWTGGETGNVTL